MMSPASLLLIFALSLYFSLVSTGNEEPPPPPPQLHSNCSALPCGILGDIIFPFTTEKQPHCGLLTVENCSDQRKRKTIKLGRDGQSFYLLEIQQGNKMVIADLEHYNQTTCGSYTNLNLSTSPFYSLNFPELFSLLQCLPNIKLSYELICNSSSKCIYYHNSSTYSVYSPDGCSFIHPQLIRTQYSVSIYNIYPNPIHLQVNVTRQCQDCYNRGGQCLTDMNGQFNCSFPVAETDSRIREHAKGHVRIIIGVGTAAGTGMLMLLVLCFWKSLVKLLIIWKKKCNKYKNIEVFLTKHESLPLKRYSYSDIKRMTDSFKSKLGEGGYGGVFKGKLLDGRNVAVKVLKGSKGNGEDFINEVSSISRTSHVNIVGLFGYCFENNKRALVYEFVPNGSLEKFIYKKSSAYEHLEWEKLYQIALGIAKGLEYLHRGCSTRIVHFDIKPHNILLDEDFCPKISDFGLAKICPRKESIMSMTGARGTIGYIAPEVISRHFGEVSHKSDVYSYGMMILEMVGGRKNVDVEVSETSKIYFPNWIYNRLQVGEELGLQGIESDVENDYARKMLTVSFWCVQTNPTNRPSMSRVMELLEGSSESLPFPPKPFLSSPRSEAADSSP